MVTAYRCGRVKTNSTYMSSTVYSLCEDWDKHRTVFMIISAHLGTNIQHQGVSKQENTSHTYRKGLDRTS